MCLAPGVFNAVFSAVDYYVQVIMAVLLEIIFSFFGAGFWSLGGTRLCSVSAPDFCPVYLIEKSERT